MDQRQALPKGYELDGVRRIYVIDSYVSAGSNSIVYQAHYEDSLMPEHVHTVLIKELYPLDGENRIFRDEDRKLVVKEEGKKFFESQKESFLLGNQAHLRLSEKGSGHIAQNVDSFPANNTLYTVLTSRKGKVLSQLLEEGEGFPSLTEAAECVKNLLTALTAFHSLHLLHLDISPDNIFLLALEEEKGFPKEVLLLDFNSVYSLDRETDSEYQYYLGKKGYTAPEIMMHRKEELGPWTDLYSVAVVFYEILTGEKLPGDRELKDSAELVSPYSRLLLHEKERTGEKVNEILKKGLEILPENRYQNIGEMQEEMQELLGILNGTIRFAAKLGDGERTGKSGSQGQGWWRLARNLALGACLGVGVTLLAGGLYLKSQEEEQSMENTKIDLTQIPLETDDSVVLTEKNVRSPLEDNIMNIQEQTSTSVRVLLKDYEHPRNLEDVFEEYSIFCFYSGKEDKRGWQFGDLTYDFFRTEDNTMHMVLPLQDTNDFDLSYIGVVFANYKKDKAQALLDITSATLTDGKGKTYEISDLVGSHLLYFDEENWQWNLTTDQNQEYVKSFADIYGGNFTVDAQVCYLEPVLEVKWESEDPKVATVDQEGRVTALSRGTTVLTVTLTDKGTGETRSSQMLVNVTRKPL